MAKQKHGIFGPVSGKLGPLSAGVWNGIPYYKLLPDPEAEKKPRSAAQLANEQRMVFMNNALVPFHAFINIGFQHMAVRKTALSAAYSRNYHQALMGEYPNFEIDYSKFMISTGVLPGLKNLTVSLAEPQKIALHWEGNTNPRARFNDQVMLVVYSPERHTVQGMAGGAIRRDLKFHMVLDNDLVGKVLEVYVSVTSFDRKKIADSVYLGRIEP